MRFRCIHCDQDHEGIPEMGARYPDYWFAVPEAERARRIKSTEDTCVIDGEEFYVRGVIEIPIIGMEEAFGFGVWVSHSKESFEEYRKNPDTDRIGPFFGWLSNELSFYAPDSTINLKTRAHYRGGRRRPFIELEPTDHPLAVDQREGISVDRALQIVHFYSDQPK